MTPPLSAPDLSLELTPDDLEALVARALGHVKAHVASLPQQPSADVEGAVELARSLKEPMPEHGAPVEELLGPLFDRVVPKSFNTAGPGYLAYIPGGGLLHSAVADLIANAVNRYTGVWLAAPGLSQLEANVVAWFCQIVGYPESARGFLTSGGSLSNFSAVFTARRELLPERFQDGTIYTSAQTHHSVQKAALLAGFPPSNVREVPADESFRVRVDLLAERIREDRAAGLTPFLVVGNAGTTNTGAVDDLDALADLARDERLWLHVDAAYGGFFMLTERGARVMHGLSRADSVALDPHKGLFLPYGTGALLVRDGPALRRAHSVRAAYLPAMREDGEFVDFCEVSPELSRPYRGLAAWLPIKLAGIGAFRANLEEKLALASWAADRLREMPEIEIVAEPQLSLLAFRLRTDGLPADEANRLNHLLLDRVNARKRVYITHTMLDGLYTLRICVLSFRTHLDRMEMAIEDLRSALAEVRPD